MGDGAYDMFSGTGGPEGYDPWFGQFADIVSSAGLDGQPFRRPVWNVEAGDEIVFVIAVQNRGSIAQAYDILLRDVMPAGFVMPPTKAPASR